MPEAISRRSRRRAPTTDAATDHVATTSAIQRTTLPKAAISGIPRLLLGVVLGRTLRHHTVGRDLEPVGSVELALADDFGIVLEGIGDGAEVMRVDDLAVVLDLEPELGLVADEALFDRIFDDSPMHLQAFALPGARIRHDFVDVFVDL